MPTTASDDRRLPDNADLENLKKRAKHFLKRIRSQDEDALERLRRVIPRSIRTPIALGDVQLVIAREYGFASWPKLKAFLETVPRNQVSSDVAGGPFEVPQIPLRDYIVFPGMEMPLYVGRSKSLSAIEAANQGQKVLLCLQRDAKTDDPQADDVYATGTLATIERTSATSAGAQVIVRGHSRARALHMEFSGSHAVAFVEPLADEQIDATEMNVAQMRSVLLRVVRKLNLPPELETEIEATFDPGKLVDLAAQHVPFGLPKRQELLELVNIRARLDRIVEMFTVLLLELEQPPLDDFVGRYQLAPGFIVDIEKGDACLVAESPWDRVEVSPRGEDSFAPESQVLPNQTIDAVPLYLAMGRAGTTPTYRFSRTKTAWSSGLVEATDSRRGRTGTGSSILLRPSRLTLGTTGNDLPGDTRLIPESRRTYRRPMTASSSIRTG